MVVFTVLCICGFLFLMTNFIQVIEYGVILNADIHLFSRFRHRSSPVNAFWWNMLSATLACTDLHKNNGFCCLYCRIQLIQL